MRRPGHSYERETFMTETESLLIAAQNNTIRTYYVKSKIDNTQQNCKCSLHGDGVKMINPIMTISKQAEKEYKYQHHWIGKGDPLGIEQEIEIWPYN